MGCEPDGVTGRPCDLPGCAASANPYVSFVLRLPFVVVRAAEVSMSRFIGLDVHRDFCEVAISEGGPARSAGRGAARRDRPGVVAGSPAPADPVGVGAAGHAPGDAPLVPP